MKAFANLSLNSRTHHYLVVDLNHFIASQYFQVDVGGGLRRGVGHNNKRVKFSALVLFLTTFSLNYNNRAAFLLLQALLLVVVVMVTIRTDCELLHYLFSWLSWVAHLLQETPNWPVIKCTMMKCCAHIMWRVGAVERWCFYIDST